MKNDPQPRTGGNGDRPRSELTTVTREILDFSTTLAERTGARAVLVYADVFESRTALREFLEVHAAQRVVLATRARDGAGETERLGAEVIPVPGVHLGRMDQVKVAVLLGLSRGAFSRGDRLVCLTGIAGSGFLDTLTFTEVGEEFEMFATTSTEGLTEQVNPEVFERVLNLAVSLGIEGREGKPVGTTFVIGDTENVLAQARAMVLNPFRGYPPEERNILDGRLTETVKEFAAIDGAFVIQADGVIEAAGMYLRPKLPGEQLPSGLGARHNAAAGITASTRALAVTVSASTGSVTVYRNGQILVEIERPRPIGPQSAPGAGTAG